MKLQNYFNYETYHVLFTTGTANTAGVVGTEQKGRIPLPTEDWPTGVKIGVENTTTVPEVFEAVPVLTK